MKNELVLGRLHRRPEAPDFALPAYIVHQSDPDPDTVGQVVDLITRTTEEILREGS